MGILGESGEGDTPPISVLLAKQHHQDNELFESLKVNNKIKVKIIGKRFEYGDTQINVIGVLENQEPIIDLNNTDNDDNDLNENKTPTILNTEIKDPLLNNSNIELNLDNESSPQNIEEVTTPILEVKLDAETSNTSELLELNIDKPSKEVNLNSDMPFKELDVLDYPKEVGAKSSGLDELDLNLSFPEIKGSSEVTEEVSNNVDDITELQEIQL